MLASRGTEYELTYSEIGWMPKLWHHFARSLTNNVLVQKSTMAASLADVGLLHELVLSVKGEAMVVAMILSQSGAPLLYTVEVVVSWT